MIMTEEEAAYVWCPHTRVVHREHMGPDRRIAMAAVNRGNANIQDKCCCIASMCSQWEWCDLPEPPIRPRQQLMGFRNAQGTTWSEPQRPDYVPPDWIWDERRGLWHTPLDEPQRGYCGLSRKP